MTPSRTRCRPPTKASLIPLFAALAACGTNFVEVQPTAPLVVVTPGALRLEARRILLTEDMPWTGIREDTALVVELDVTNLGPAPQNVNIASLTCLLELDAAAPGDTLSMPLSAGDLGSFPGEMGQDILTVKPIWLPAGGTQRIWALFGGYRYAGSDVPRRVVLTLASADGRPVRLVLADPARGALRWTLPTRKSSLMLGLENTNMLGGTTKAQIIASELTLFRRLGRVLLDLDLSSSMLVQTQGSLVSQTSSFAGSGLAAHVAYPLFNWGPEQDPRRLGLYAGGQGQLLVSIDPPPPSGQTPMPHVYGVLSAEGGIDFEVGALAPAGGPFPIKATGTPLPRWFIRFGYTHWFVNGGGADGFTSSVRLAW